MIKAAQLRQAILQSAVQGKLVPQNPHDEPASVLLERIKADKAKLIKEGKLKKENPLPPITEDEIPYDLPENWNWCRLGEISNYGHNDINDPDDIPADSWLLELEDIEKETGRIIKKIQKKDRPTKSTKYAFSKGQVLFGKLRPYLNKVVVAPANGFCSSEILPLSFGEINPKYSALFLRNPFFVDYATSKSYGVKMPRLGTNDGVKALFPLPPLAEQQRIVAKVEELMLLCAELEAAEKELDKLEQSFAENLPKSILQAAVQGKLVPQNPHDEPASVLLERIKADKAKLIKEGKLKKEKPLPLITEDEIPYDLPENWNWCRLGDIHSIHRGITFPASVKGNEQTKGCVCCATTGSVQEVYNPRADVFVPEKYVKNQDQWLLNNDIIMSTANSRELVGKTCFWKGKERKTFGGFLTIIRACGDIPVKYSYYVLQYLWKTGAFVTTSTQTTNIANINNSILVSTVIPLPPLAEQRHIVAKVDELMALCGELKTVEKAIDASEPKQTTIIPLGKSQENEPLKMVARGDMDLGISEEARQDVDELFNDMR